jgi:hypothetical protein
LVAAGTVMFLTGRYYGAILLLSLAAAQNQPLILYLAFVHIVHFTKVRFNLSALLKAGILSIPALLPSLFYYLLFGTTNLIKDAGFLSTKYIHFTRLFGFFFDFNQGMVLSLPFLLIYYVYMLLYNYTTLFSKKKIITFDLLIPFVVIAMTTIVATMINWNHGQSVINRYATWMGSIILVHSILLIPYKKSFRYILLLITIFASQLFTTLYHSTQIQYDWLFHKPFAKNYTLTMPYYSISNEFILLLFTNFCCNK